MPPGAQSPKYACQRERLERRKSARRQMERAPGHPINGQEGDGGEGDQGSGRLVPSLAPYVGVRASLDPRLDPHPPQHPRPDPAHPYIILIGCTPSGRGFTEQATPRFYMGKADGKLYLLARRSAPPPFLPYLFFASFYHGVLNRRASVGPGPMLVCAPLELLVGSFLALLAPFLGPKMRFRSPPLTPPGA